MEGIIHGGACFRNFTVYLTGAVHTYPDIFENGDFFLPFSFQSTCIRRFQAPKTAGFLKRSPEWSYLLKNAGLSFSLRGRTETDVFEYDDVIHHTAHALLGMIPSSHSFGIFAWMSVNDSNTLRVEIDVHFFENGE